MIGNKLGMNDLLKLALEIIVIVLAIYLAIWLISGGGFDIIKAKTNTAFKGEPFDKEGDRVESYLTDGESECRLQCSWTNKNNNPIYLYEELNDSNKGRCYCKY